MPEARMLLMAGLMLADKTAGLEDKIKQADTRIAQLQAQIDTLEARPADRVEVPVVPTEVTEAMAEVAARAEALADQLENSQST
jgi:cell division protein ZapA